VPEFSWFLGKGLLLNYASLAGLPAAELAVGVFLLDLPVAAPADVSLLVPVFVDGLFEAE